MKKRLSFKCWKCKHTYSLFKEITDQQTLIIACPFCHAEARVELPQYRTKPISLLRGGTGEVEAIEYEYDFPAVIPTEQTE